MSRIWRIFVRDAGRRYTALCPSTGNTEAEAVQNAPASDELKQTTGMLKAIEWPPTASGLRWLDQHLPPVPNKKRRQ